MGMGSTERNTKSWNVFGGKVLSLGLVVILIMLVSATVHRTRPQVVLPIWMNEMPNRSEDQGQPMSEEMQEIPYLKGKPSSVPYLEKRNLKVLLRNTEPKTGTTALEWTIMALFREACAEFQRSEESKSGTCSISRDKRHRAYSMELNGSNITFSAMQKHYLDFQDFVYPMASITNLASACAKVGLSGWSESCAGFAKTGIKNFVPRGNEDFLYVNIYRDPIAATVSWVNYIAKETLTDEELNRQVKDICPHVAARIGLRARIAWKILPSKGYPVYSYGYETMMDRQDIWVDHLLKAMGLHMSSESVRAALDSVSPSAMKDLLEQAKEGLVKELPPGLDLKGVNSHKVGNASTRGYSEVLDQDTLDSCRQASLKHLPIQMNLKYLISLASKRP